MALLRRFFRNENGATAIEYAMVAGMVSMAILSSVLSMGTNLHAIFTNLKAGFPT